MDKPIIRSNRPEVRNPVLKLPSVRRLQALPPEIRELLREALMEMRADCQSNADKFWARHKAPIASYWKVTGVYAGHFARALRDSACSPVTPLAATESGEESASVFAAPDGGRMNEQAAA